MENMTKEKKKYLWCKEIFDRVVAFIALVILLLLFLLVASYGTELKNRKNMSKRNIAYRFW